MQPQEIAPNIEITQNAAFILPHLCHYTSVASPLPLVAVEGETHIMRYGNPAFCRLAAIPPDELLGKPFDIVVPEGAANGCAALLDRVFRTGKTETLADQEHGLASSKLYWSYTAWLVFDTAERPLGLMVQITDTTEAVLLRQQTTAMNEALMVSGIRQHELAATAHDLNARLERAMQETHHRVKNNLQIISSLVEMQMAEGEPAVPIEALERIASYIHSLAVLHDLLTQKVKSDNDDSTLSTVDSLSRLLPLLQSSIGETRRIVTEVIDIDFPSSTTVSLSLLINELITNAAKYSAGDIVLSLTADETHAVLTVSNEGAGFPPNFDPVRDANTGMGLILSFARHDLRGAIKFCNTPEGGACVVVRFPLPKSA